jgi:hypothetical protein
VLPLVALAAAIQHRHRIAMAILSIAPIGFYLAMWSGNILALFIPAIVYFSWPVRPEVAASSLSTSMALLGPQSIQLRYWLMLGCAGVIVLGLLLAAAPALDWRASKRRAAPA